MRKSAMARMEWLVGNFAEPDPSLTEVLSVGRYDTDGAAEVLFPPPRFNLHRLPAHPADSGNGDCIAVNPYHWPEIADASLDAVVSLHALEHMEFFWLCLTQAARALRAGGLFLAVEPRGLGRHRRLPDCYRFDVDGMIALARYANLEILHASCGMAPPDAPADWFEDGEEAMLAARKPVDWPGMNNGENGYARPESDRHALRSGFLMLREPIRANASTARSGTGEAEEKDEYIDDAGVVNIRQYERSWNANLKRRRDERRDRFRLFITGNCFIRPMLDFARAASPDIDVVAAHIHDGAIDAEAIAKCDLLITTDDVEPERFGVRHERTVTFPFVTFGAFHPDAIYLRWPGGRRYAVGPNDVVHSRIAIECFRRGYDEQRTRDAFNADVYEALGFFSVWQKETAALGARLRAHGFDLDDMLPGWMRGGCFMHMPTHPKAMVIADLMLELFRRHGVPVENANVAAIMDDAFAARIFPVYPEIAARLGVPECGGHVFKLPKYSYNDNNEREKKEYLSLDEFIYLSFRSYRRTGLERVEVPRIDFA